MFMQVVDFGINYMILLQMLITVRTFRTWHASINTAMLYSLGHLTVSFFLNKNFKVQ
jgi:hypothetical protein